MTDMTAFATKAMDLATSVKANLGSVEIEPGAYHVDITAPDGPSTGGGVQALQHIRLVPKTDGYLPLVIGNANQQDKVAELKTYEHVDALHQKRFSRPVDLDKEQYEKFLDQIQKFLEGLRINVTRTEAPAAKPAAAKAAPASVASPAAPGEAKPMPLMIIVAVVVAAVMVYFLVK